MATADQYAAWIVANADKRGTPEFETVAAAYQEAKAEEAALGDSAGAEREGFFSSIANTAGTLGSAFSAGKFAAAAPEQAAQAREQLIADESPEGLTTSFEQIEDPASAWSWFKQTAGSSLGFLVAPGAVAAATKLAGAPNLAAKVAGYGTLGAQYLITNLTRQAQEQKAAIEAGETPNTTSLGKAIISSAAQTGLDVLQFGTIFKPIVSKFPVLGKLMGEQGEAVAKRTEDQLVDALRKGEFSTSGGIVRGLAAGAAFEIPQEIAQQMLERWQADQPLTGEDAGQEYLEAAVGALALGGSMGALSGFVDTASQRAQAQDIVDEREAVAREKYETEKEEAQRVAQEAADRQAELDKLSKDAPEGQLKGTEAIAKLYEDAKAFALTLPTGYESDWKEALRQQFPNLEPGYDTWIIDELKKNKVIYKRGSVIGVGETAPPKKEFKPGSATWIDLQNEAYEFLQTLPPETEKGQWADALTKKFDLFSTKSHAWGLLKDAVANRPELFHRRGSGLYGLGPKPTVDPDAQRKKDLLAAYDRALAAMPATERGFYGAEREKLSSAKTPAAIDAALGSLQPIIDKYTDSTIDAKKPRNEVAKKLDVMVRRAQKDKGFAAALGEQIKNVRAKVEPLYRGTFGNQPLLWNAAENAEHGQIASTDLPALEKAAGDYTESLKKNKVAAMAAAKAQRQAEIEAERAAKKAERDTAKAAAEQAKAASKAKAEADKAAAKTQREARQKTAFDNVLAAFTSNPEFADRAKAIPLTATKISEITGLNRMTEAPAVLSALHKAGHIEKSTTGKGYSLPATKKGEPGGKPPGRDTGADGAATGAGTAGTASQAGTQNQGTQETGTAGVGGAGAPAAGAAGGKGKGKGALKPEGEGEGKPPKPPKGEGKPPKPPKGEGKPPKPPKPPEGKPAARSVEEMTKEGEELYKAEHLSLTQATALERYLKNKEFDKAEGILRQGRKDRELMQQAAAEAAASEVDSSYDEETAETETAEQKEIREAAEASERRKAEIKEQQRKAAQREEEEGGGRALAYSSRDEVTREEKSAIEEAVDESASDPAVFSDKLAEKTSNKFYKYMAQLLADRVRELQKIGVRLEVEITDTITDEGKNRKDYAGMVTPHLSRQVRGKLDRITIQLRTNSKDGRTLYADGRNYITAIHEMIHAVTIGFTYAAKHFPSYLSRETVDAVKELEKVHVKALAAVKKIGAKPSHTWTDVEAAAWKLYQESNAFDNTDELIAQSFSDIDMQRFLNTIKYPAKGGWRTLFNDFIAAIRNLIGITIKEDSALEAVVKATSVLMDADLAGPHFTYSSASANAQAWLNDRNKNLPSAPALPSAQKPRKKAEVFVAPPIRNETHEERVARKAAQTGRKANPKKVAEQTTTAVMVEKGYEKVVRKFQDDRRPIKRLQDFLEKAKRLIVTGDFNNLHDHIVLSSGKAFNAMTEYMQGHMDRLDRAVLKYAEARGIEPNLALGYLQTYFEALHEPERRQVKFEMNVPLNIKTVTQLDKNIIPAQSPLYNAKGSAAELREYIIAELSSNKDLVSNGYAEKYRKALTELVYRNAKTVKRPDGTTYKVGEFMDNTIDGATTVKDRGVTVTGMSFDPYDRVYDVIGAYSQQQLKEDRDAYNRDPHKDKVDEIYRHMKRLQDATVRLDKQSNYWSKPVDNIRGFYGWKNYIPMKGQGEGGVHKSDDRFNFNSPRLGAGYNDMAGEFSGRSSDSDNPVLQVMADATKASLRYGRKDVSTAIKNLINQKHIKGRPYATIDFRDRFRADVKFDPSSDKFFFVYKPDGTIEIYEVTDPLMKEAIRRSISEQNPLVQVANNVTGFMGHMHTRYNVAFHPYNFVRDALTNAFTLGSEMGPVKAAKLLQAVAVRVGRSGVLTKAMEISRLYANGKVDKIREMAKTDTFAGEILEYLEEGGRIAYIQGLSSKSQAEEMMKDIERGGFSRHKEVFDKWVDTWADGFEFTSRAATYAVMKAEFKAQGLTEAEARIRATSYAKNLANFEQVGEYGKAMGGMFMFFRPAITGAVRAIDAILPAFRSTESVVNLLPDSLKNDAEAVENIKKDHIAKQKNARRMIFGLLGMGATLYLMAMLASDDDEQGRNKIQIDDMALWTRNIRLPLDMFGDKDSYLQIPWGFGVGAFGAMGAQIAGVAFGKTSLAEAAPNFFTIALDSYMPIPFERIDPTENFAAFLAGTITPSIGRPFVEWAMNVDSLGREIYNNRLNKYGDAFTGGSNVPEAYRDLSRYILKVSGSQYDVQPTTLMFWANNYIDGISRIGHGLYGLNMYFTGEKKIDVKSDMPLVSSFLGRKSNYDGREFASIEGRLKEESAKLTSLEFRPELYRRYVKDNPYLPDVVDHFNSVINNELKDIRSEKKAIESSDLSPDIRKEQLEALRIEENMIKRSMINLYRQYGIKP